MVVVANCFHTVKPVKIDGRPLVNTGRVRNFRARFKIVKVKLGPVASYFFFLN